MGRGRAPCSKKSSYFRLVNQLVTHLQRTLRLLRRCDRRAGYGIHSPFAFSFVTGVVYERAPYYGYAALDRFTAATPGRRLRQRDYRLLFRLANFQRATRAFIAAGADEPCLREALTAARPALRWTDLPDEADLWVIDSLDTRAATHIGLLREGALAVVIDVASTRRRREAWQALAGQPIASVTFDLGDFGLIFSRPDLQRQHYVIAYR